MPSRNGTKVRVCQLRRSRSVFFKMIFIRKKKIKNFNHQNVSPSGISINCADIYRHNIDCQWVDISELDTGLYTLKVAINPEFKVPEMSYDNNAAICSLLYTETYARAFDCRMVRP